MSKIPVAGPWITEKEIEYVTDAVRTAWYEDANTYHQRLEAAFAEYLGRRYAVALPSCTAAIHLGLAALGVGESDEVIVPDLTWIASAAPVSYVGANPVFADVAPDSWCLDAEAVRRCVSDRSKAIIAVNLYGNMPDMAALESLSAELGLPLIEDAAESIGSEIHGRKAGSFGSLSVFSFHGSKTLTSGEGGMLVTDDEQLHARVRFLMDHGRAPGDVSFSNVEVAYKYKMSSMQAALALAQLERIDELVTKKRQIFSWYAERLSGVEGISLNPEPAGCTNSYWMSTVVLDPDRGLEKFELIERLAERGIDSRPIFSPLSSLKAYADSPDSLRAREANVNAYRLGPYGINLPSALKLTETDVEQVCEALKSALAS